MHINECCYDDNKSKTIKSNYASFCINISSIDSLLRSSIVHSLNIVDIFANWLNEKHCTMRHKKILKAFFPVQK